MLEGFDFGVGMLLRVRRPRPTDERARCIHTIGPVWDGNEVWLLVAGGATFAAFPEWYATLFTGFYLALFLLLRRADRAQRRLRVLGQGRRRRAGAPRWEWAIVVGSALPALLCGVAWANIVARRAARRAAASTTARSSRC